jgi:hypothetical protein
LSPSYGRWLSSAKRLVWDQETASSNLARPTKCSDRPFVPFRLGEAKKLDHSCPFGWLRPRFTLGGKRDWLRSKQIADNRVANALESLGVVRS